MAENAAQSIPVTPKKTVSTREIWSLTWPQALMMFFNFLIGFTDVWVAGRINEHVQAAFGIVTQCMFFFMVVSAAVVSGGMAAMSQALGARLPLRALRYVGLILKIGLSICVLAMTACYFFREQILALMQVPDKLAPVATHIFTIMLPLIPAQFFMFLTLSIFRSRKNVWFPLGSSMIVCLVNGVADFGFGLGYFGLPSLGANGLVLATVCSVLAGGIFTAFFLIRSKYVGVKSFGPWRWEKKALPYLIKVAIPAGGMQVLWQLGYVVLFAITSALPKDPVSAVGGLTTGMRVESILFLPAIAFNMTASILIGHCLGSGDRAEARRVALKIMISGALIMSAVGAMLFPFTQKIARFIAPDPGISAVAVSYIRFNIFATPFTVTSIIMSGIMIGAGSTVYTFFIYSGATWLIRLPIAWYLGHHLEMDVRGVFTSMLVSQIFQSTAAFFVLLRCDWYRFASTAKRFR